MADDTIIKRTVKRIANILGITTPEDTAIPTSSAVEISSYSEKELRNLPGVREKPITRNATTPQDIMSNLLSVAQNSTTWTKQAESLTILAPEIAASRDIMVSSIMSPTDMQTDSIKVICENTGLGTDIESEVTQLLTDFFNDTVELCPKVTEWLGDALYKTGAVPILVLPQSNITTLNTAVDLENAGIFTFSDSTTNINSKKKKVSSETFNGISCETLATAASYESIAPQIEEQVLSIVSDLFVTPLPTITNDNTVSVEELKRKNDAIIGTAKEVSSKMKSFITDASSNFVITTDQTMFTLANNRNSSVLAKMTKEINSKFILDKSNPVFMMDTAMNEGDSATLLKLPYHCVVPVIIPGAPNQHLGYFILVDQWGNPLIDGINDNPNNGGTRKLTEANMQATFGNTGMYSPNAKLGDEQRFEVASTVFGVTLKNVLDSKLKEFGFVGATFSEHESVTSCLFRNLLKQKKTGLVFVPEAMMVYYRFDTHEDGTGKSIIEDLATILALRTTLTIAGVMSAIENSIDQKTIEVDIDIKNANAQQMLDMIRNTFTDKRMLRFNNNPLTVQQDLVQRSLTIIPKNMKGLSEGLSVSKDNKSTGAVMPDKDLMDYLTNAAITQLQVPAASLNHLSENEYSRSVATTNIFFSNNIKGKQKIVVKHTTKLVQRYAQFSSVLQKKIMTLLGSTKVAIDDNNKKVTPSVKPGIESAITRTDEIETNDSDNISRNLKLILNNIKVTLPSPQIVVDRSQFKEIEEFTNTTAKVLDMVFNEDMVMDDNAKEMLKVLKANVAGDMVRSFIKTIGFNSVYDIPKPEDINLSDSKELYQWLINQKIAFDNFKKHVVDKVVTEEDSGGGYSGGSDSSDSGGSGNFGADDEEGDLDASADNDENTPTNTGDDETEEGSKTDEQGDSTDESEKEESTKPEDLAVDDTPPPDTL